MPASARAVFGSALPASTLFASTLFASTLLLSPLALARPMTAEDVARIQFAGNVAVSHDGSAIAYTRFHRPDVTRGEPDGTSRQQLHMADAAFAVREYLPEGMSVSAISFSPDGSLISFIWAGDGEDRAVWAIPVNGGAQRKLAAVKDAAVRSYTWAPNGRSIYMLTAPAPDTRRKEEAGKGFTAVIYEEEEAFNRLFVANVQLGSAAVVDAAPRAIEVPGHVDLIKLSPNGNWALITSAPSTLVDDSYTSKQAHIFDVARGEVLRTIDTPGKLGDLEISPDGRQLSMIAAVDRNDPADITLHLVDVAAGTYRALNEGAAEAAVDAEWMADGRLAVAVHVGAQSLLRFYTPQGEVEREVDPGALIINRLAQGGNRLAMLADAPTHPPELYMFNGAGFDRWTDHNPWLADISFAPQRTVRYNARDGQEIEGVLIEPLGGVPEGGAPTIMNIHGGPEAHDSNGWITGYASPGQVAAGAGYAVFLPNYRGSTAYGTAFSKAHSGNYTDPEFTDIVDAKYALAEMGITDPARVGITGASYGGYATAWGATAHSEEYAAGVMSVGISNQISKFGTGDIPHEMYLVHSLAWPWDDWQKMLEVSPIYHTGKAETPLLILHGEQDTRVHPGQSLELYRFIKLRRPETPLRLVLYPREGHGNARAAARYDFNLRMMEWFDTYLKTGDRTAALPDPRPVLTIAAAE